jgi:hypothetical protein
MSFVLAPEKPTNTREFRGQHRCPKCLSWKTGTDVSLSSRESLAFRCDDCGEVFSAANPAPF